MTTALNIIESAARKLSVLGRGQNLSAGEAQDFLSGLNSMLETMSIQGGMITKLDIETFNLTSAASYTIGDGGDFDTTRPLFIEAAYIRDGDTDHGLSQINARDYSNIDDKSSQGIPEFFFYDNNQPLGRIYLWYVPISGYTLTLTSRKAITAFADLTTEYDLAEGVKPMLEANLAVWMAPEYEKEASPTIKKQAKDTKNAVLGYNNRQDYPTSSIDDVPADRAGGFNIYTGQY